jgi:hypothetical protein
VWLGWAFCSCEAQLWTLEDTGGGQKEHADLTGPHATAKWASGVTITSFCLSEHHLPLLCHFTVSIDSSSHPS